MTIEIRDGFDSSCMYSVSRKFPGERYLNGFILGVGKDLVLLLQFHDFYPEGYTLIRVMDIEEITCGDRERFFGDIIKEEGLWDGRRPEIHVDLRDFKSLLESIIEINSNVIVECESHETEEDDEFYIGRIISMEEEGVSFLNFSVTGIWDENPVYINYTDITKVQFSTPYLNTISRHLRDRT